MDKAFEKVSLALTFNNHSEALKVLEIAKERRLEAQAMIKEGKNEHADKAVSEWTKNIDRANKEKEELEENEENEEAEEIEKGIENAIGRLLETINRFENDENPNNDNALKGLNNALGNLQSNNLKQLAKEKSEEMESEEDNLELFVSDAPADIGDFESLIVEFSQARAFMKGSEEPEINDTNQTNGNETNGNGVNTTNLSFIPLSTHNVSMNNTGNETDTNTTDDSEEGNKGFTIIDLTGESVDLTQLIDGNIESLITTHLEPGTYTKVELHVTSAVGIVNETEVTVKVPSSKLMITRNFEIVDGTLTGFVFDINVVKTGKGYNLKPVISKSGVIGEDIPEDEVTEVETTE